MKLRRRWLQEYVEATTPQFVVGEVWNPCCYEEDDSLAYNQDPHRQQIVDWCDQTGNTACAFDFTTKVRPFDYHVRGLLTLQTIVFRQHICPVRRLLVLLTTRRDRWENDRNLKVTDKAGLSERFEIRCCGLCMSNFVYEHSA